MLEKATIYQQVKKYDFALKTLLRISIDSLSPKIAQQVRYELAVSYYTIGNFQACRNTIMDFLSSANKQDSIQCQWLHILSMLDIQNFENIQITQDLYKRFVEDWANETVKDSLLKIWKLPKFKNPILAERLSFFPGLGQIYAGSWYKGISSMMIQSAFVFMGSYWLLNHYYVSSALVGYGLFFSFYFGGQRLAHNIVDKSNQEKFQNFAQGVRNTVLWLETQRRQNRR